MSYAAEGNYEAPPGYLTHLSSALDGALITAAQPAASFACCGQLRRGEVGPKIQVQGVGRFTGPLTREQATALQGVCQQAPFGRGAETVVDLNVRSTLQLEPGRLAISNEADWNNKLSHILTDVCSSLGVPRAAAEVSAQLHKLLLYKPGSFFKRHTDSEKAPGMFGTLVVCLPAAYSGGQLLVYHKDSSKRFGSGELPPDCVSYVAFYADCEHEVKRVTSGYRLCLTYNLCYKQPGAAAAGVTGGDSSAVAATAAAMQDWVAAADGPSMLFYMLDHLYTSESRAALSAAALKGADAARAGVAMAAAAQSGIELALVKMTRREEGEAHDTYGEDDDEEEEDEDEEEEEEGDYDEDDSAAAAACGGGRGGGKRGREYPASSGSDHGIEDVYEIKHTASEWVLMSGGVLGFKDMAVDKDAVLQDWRYWRHHKPSKSEGGRYTGNEGCPMSLWYTQTALAMWRKQDSIMIQLQGTGFSTLLHYLKQLVSRMQHLKRQQQQQQQQQPTADTAAAAPTAVECSAGTSAAAAAAEAGTAAAAYSTPSNVAAFPPAYDGDRQLLLPDVTVYTMADACHEAAEQVAGVMLANHEKGGAISSTKLAKLLQLLLKLDNPSLIKAFFTGPLAAAVAYATSHIHSRVADNGRSVLCLTTATGRHFAWADLAKVLVSCCDKISWNQLRQLLLPMLREHLVAVRDKRWASVENSYATLLNDDKLHRNPLMFEAVYSQILVLILQLAGLPFRTSTADALTRRCTHIPEKPHIPGKNHRDIGDPLGEYEEQEAEDYYSSLTEKEAIKAAVQSAAESAEAAAAAGAVLPSASALQELHTAVQADVGPDQMLQVLSGLPGWQLSMCKDILELMLKALLEEEGGTGPPEMFRRHSNEDELPVIHTPRDAGLLLALLQAVYVLGHQEQLEQLVNHITRQLRVYDLRSAVAPATLEFCQWLGDTRLSQTPAAGQLLQSCVTSLQQLTAAGAPATGDQKWRMDTDYLRFCLVARQGDGCSRCNAILAFLSDGREQTWRFRGSREDRDHIRAVIPPYVTWQQQQRNELAYRPVLPDSDALEAKAKCNVKLMSDKDDPASQQPETVRRGEVATAAAARAAGMKKGRSGSSGLRKGSGAFEYVAGRRAPGMTAAREAAMARTGVLTLQKLDKNFEEHVQQYKENMALLSMLQTVGGRVDIAASGTRAGVAAITRECEVPNVRTKQEDVTGPDAAEAESPHRLQDVKQESLLTNSAAAAGGGEVGEDCAVRGRGRAPGSSKKHSRSPAAAAAAPATHVTRSRAAANKKSKG